MKPNIGDLFTYDYITFYRVIRSNCLCPVESRKLIERPNGDWKQAVQNYRKTHTVQVWEVNYALRQFPDFPGAVKRIDLDSN